ncbi:hypothetical protein OG21DRAFT_1602098, partial [Imleria badia]
MALLTLPLELIEAILICSCSPRTVASVAQTCRTLHTLVYGSPDSHLWRELFLTTWDDPRPALEHRALVDPRIDPAALDWGTEYRRRVSSDKWLKAWRRDICLPDSETAKDADTDWHATALSALSTVLDTLLTLRPFPATPPIALTVLTPATAISPYPTGNIGSGVGSGRERMTSAPPLPPLLILLACGISVFEASRSGARVSRTVYGPHASRSAPGDGPGREVAELELVPTPSLPPQLVRTLLASHAVGVRGLPAYAPTLSGIGRWGGDAVGEVFHRIICITGFAPIPPPLVSTFLSTSTTTTVPEFVSEHAGSASADMDVMKNADGEKQHEENYPEADEHPMRRTPKAFPIALQQHADARILARRKVYDMQYLRGDRLWGPFQVVTRGPPDARSGASRADDDRKGKAREGGKRASTSGAASGRGGIRRLGPFAWAMDVDINPNEFDSDSTSDDSKDEDWRDPADRGQKSSSTPMESGDRERDQGSGSENTADADEHPLISLILDSDTTTDTADTEPSSNLTSPASRRRTRRSNPRLPRNCSVCPRQIKPHHLRPDYTYLASVRIVVEANLRDLFRSEINHDVERAVSQVWTGGVGMFWEDEDEILRAQARSSEPAASLSHVSSSTTTTPSDIPAANTNSNTFELADILAQFENLEVARLGSACGYWGGWIERQQSTKRSIDGDADADALSSEGDIGARKPRIVAERAQLERPIEGTSTIDAKGKGKEKDREPADVPAFGTGLGDWEIGPEGEACDGWDWAGVAGIWSMSIDDDELTMFPSSRRRCLDFSKFLTLDTQEACRIIPMELRITGYTRAGPMPIYDTNERDNINILHLPDNRRPKTGVCTGYFRPLPVIHFSGAAVGSDRNMEDGRKISGSVQLIGGGEVRWQMDTYAHESDLSASLPPEWSSEGVQVGGIGSAVGVLGMWTGAEHERADPLVQDPVVRMHECQKNVK